MDPRVSVCETPEECEQLAKNVEDRDQELARAARRRAIELRAAKHGATRIVEREALEAVYAYERARSKQKGRKVHASRTWQMIREHGVLGAVDRLVSKRQASTGYTTLVEMGMQDLAFEAVVLRHRDAFSPMAVSRSEERMKGWGDTSCSS